MKNKEAIQELEGLSTFLASLPKKNPFEVPNGYFERLAEDCMHWINLSPSFGTNQPVQQVPEGYFDNLANQILIKVKAADADPVINTGTLKNPYEVPGGYFENLPEQILRKVKPARVISIRKTFYRYAVAAVITGLLGLTVFSSLNNTEERITYDMAILADAKTIIKTNSFEKVLESVKGDEIIEYLSRNGQDVEAALVASATDNSNLPAKEDYLLDENTLNDFLNEINIKNYNN